LLASHESAGEFLASPTATDVAPLRTRAPSEGPGSHIGPYRLLQLIGEGGFGSVFLAEQERPIRRRVALKVIKLGMDTSQVIARFEAERQALAMMEHPNIARVFDAGATETGRPFFVMELATGDPITTYCDRQNLSVEDRLHLFVQVCHAVQHAHSKGIIHRDIKPSNVLVTLADGKAIPKVIDFGIAKATSVRLAEQTALTERMDLIGTPEYMSPEQAQLNGIDIDTRSDIYSLGVLLYELLTGALPFDPKRLRSAAFAEIQRIIREEDPAKPSTRLSTLEALPSIAARRQIEPARLQRLVRGDLDWIVMMCLDKDRSRRYETADGLALDVRRHLAGEPVIAAPPSAVYRGRKFVRRHRTGMLAASAILLALFLGMVGTSIGMARAVAEAKRADDETERARLAEAAERQRAEELASVVEFQASQLSGIDPQRMGALLKSDILAKWRSTSLAGETAPQDEGISFAALESALARVNFTSVAVDALNEIVFEASLKAIDAEFSSRPVLQARLLQTVAHSLQALGLLDRAAVPQRQALELRRAHLGEEHPDTLVSINHLGLLLQAQGRFAEAEAEFSIALEARRRLLGDEHPDTLISLHNMSQLLQSRRRLAEAEPYQRMALAGRRRSFGEEHPQTLSSLHNLGAQLRGQGKLAEAEEVFRDVHQRRSRILGEEHAHTLVSLNNFAAVLQERGRFEEAERHFRRYVEASRRILGDDHPQTLTAINNLGVVLRSLRRFDEAEGSFLEAIDGMRRVLGEDHLNTLNAVGNMGILRRAQNRFAEAEPYLRDGLERRQRILGPDHPDTLDSLTNLAAVLREQGLLDEAESLGREAVQRSRAVFPPDHWLLGIHLSHHGRTLFKLGRFVECESELLEAHGILVKALGETHDTVKAIRTALAEHYDAWHSVEPERGHDQRALQWRSSAPAASSAESSAR
jgi:eukaryotic-like serine/threonine-protein kinase